MEASQTAFELLLEIDRRCRLLAADLPSQESRLQNWSGIGFRIAEHWYVAPMGEIAEVLHEPRLSAIPGVKPWVMGVSNLRGRLLPVFDLCGFLGHELSSQRRQRRVLVLDHNDIFAGLMVDEVQGLQHFKLDSLVMTPPPGLPAAIAPFVQGYFQREQVWGVFSSFALAQAPDFLDVARQHDGRGPLVTGTVQ
ncbi:chemotaxis protein CheW [Pseudomonas sp. R5(2019)]|uniref:chemotaxis protein CheW n=1 Tax=Pseudomonas sp. R5(2019) TaxID=2697566 RepID=UPI00141213E2|nr:chemotaxis protein CheW [Pseudomonas sp. R5(2019)]NBA96634.1 chemotaxis protein CheW [Pseudomonas sp. R5(2019)]